MMLRWERTKSPSIENQQRAKSRDTPRVSRENVELTRGYIDAFERRDFEAFIAYCDPKIEFRSVFAAVGGAVYQGHAEVRKYFEDLEVWGEGPSVEVEAYFDLGERTLVFVTWRGRGRHSGAEVSSPGALLFQWRDGLAVSWKGYRERADALRDLDLSEDELEPIA
jgi:ketosteroid isomerase-like protein